MKVSKRRCHFCKRWFQPNPRNPNRQQACSSAACQQKRRADNNRRWRQKNPGYGQSRQPKIRAWAKEYPDYWHRYRRQHPDYVGKERCRRRSAHKRAKNAAKQDSDRKISVEKLESIRDLAPISAAKQDSVHRRINGILDYLFWKENAAKQDAIANQAAGERQYEYASGNLGGDKAVESG